MSTAVLAVHENQVSEDKAYYVQDYSDESESLKWVNAELFLLSRDRRNTPHSSHISALPEMLIDAFCNTHEAR